MKTALEIIKLLVVFLIPKFASEVPQECANFGIGTLKRFPIERTQDACHSLSSVIAGLDPAIHLLRKSVLRRRWTRGASPRVTPENG
jgi:hypothetical protein